VLATGYPPPPRYVASAGLPCYWLNAGDQVRFGVAQTSGSTQTETGVITVRRS